MSSGGGGFNPIKPVVNAWGDITGSNRLADVQGQMGAASLAQQQADRSLALQFAEPSEMEMQQLEQAIVVNKQDIARKEKLLASSDPALIEAGNQALALLQGKEAAGLDPLKRQRSEQRKQLEQTLAQRLGPDYAQSSAGIMALNQFDQQTADTLAVAQQQSLGQLLGIAQNTQSFGSLQPNIGNALGIAGQRGAINNRRISAIQGTPIDASLRYAGDAAQARAYTQNFGQLLKLGTTAAGAYFGGGMGAFAGSQAGDAMAPIASAPGGSYTDTNYKMPAFGGR